MAIEIEYEGKKYSFNGQYRTPRRDEYFLSDTGEVKKALPGGSYLSRAMLTPVVVTHTFGEIVFEEVDDRAVKLDEWFLSHEGGIRNWQYPLESASSYMVVRPVTNE